jgi:hypothetical protein
MIIGFFFWQRLSKSFRLTTGRVLLHFILLATVITICSGCKEVSNQVETGAPVTVNFESGDVGKVPRDFTVALTGGGGRVSWVVREAPDAPEGKPVLVQESSDDTSYRFPMCIYKKVVARDVSAEVKWKAISGKVDQAGGIVLRYRPENYYIARANSLEGNVDLFKTVRGRRLLVEEVPATVTTGTWHTLRFEAKGRHLLITFDGKVMIDKDDRTFSSAGEVGLWTKADSVSAFANLRIGPAN